MTSSYNFRGARIDDIPFLAKAVISALKSNSNKFGLAALTDLSEDDVFKIIIDMFNEEIDGCEYSLSSYLVANFLSKPIAAVGGWIEGFNCGIPSSVIKSNLMRFHFPEESIELLLARSALISKILIERERLTLQIENVFVDYDHRGTGLGRTLIRQHIENALAVYPELKKAQVQLFGNNNAAIKLYEKCGFQITQKFKEENVDILKYVPYNTILLMEKQI